MSVKGIGAKMDEFNHIQQNKKLENSYINIGWVRMKWGEKKLSI